MTKNVFGESLLVCSTSPLTGYFRNGCCETGDSDMGTHTVCAVMTQEFLDFSKKMGNDLITPIPNGIFPGLVPGDHWCLCVSRWMQAYREGIAPKIYLEATHEKTLEFISLEELVKYAKVLK
jgi:uncharacterized protein (DUF2237 family)